MADKSNCPASRESVVGPKCPICGRSPEAHQPDDVLDGREINPYGDEPDGPSADPVYAAARKLTQDALGDDALWAATAPLREALASSEKDEPDA